MKWGCILEYNTHIIQFFGEVTRYLTTQEYSPNITNTSSLGTGMVLGMAAGVEHLLCSSVTLGDSASTDPSLRGTNVTSR